jgi:hypothetical protein
MHRATSHFLPLALVLMIAVTSWASVASRYHEPSATGGDVNIIATSPQRNVTRVQIQEPQLSIEGVDQDGERFSDVWIEDESHTTEPGLPSLPLINRLIGVPDRGMVRLIIDSAEYTEESGYRVYPSQGMEEEPNPVFRYNREFYGRNAWYPQEIATIGEPAVFRDIRLVNVSICPVQYNPAIGTIRTYHHIDVHVETVPGQGINEKTRSFDHPSTIFLPMYRELLNYQYLDLDDEPQPPGTYLIICADDPAPIGYAQQLAQWKQRKGIPARIATLSETGNTYAEIKAYIQTAYDTWEPPLEFVVLLGDDTGNILDPYSVPSSGGYGGSDHPYTEVAGNDILGDIAIGRLSARNATEMNYVVSKTLRYEREPYMTGPPWFTQGHLSASTSHMVTSSTSVMMYIQAKMYQQGFNLVTFQTQNGHINATLMRQMIDAGRSFFFARGAWIAELSPIDLEGLSNGWMMPFVMATTCATGNFSVEDATLSEAWLRYGSAANGGGAIGAIGAATSGNHTRFLNTMVFGVAHGFFVNGTHYPGVALMEGKLQLYRNYYPQGSNYVQDTSEWHNLMGDPEVPIWTAVPTAFDVVHPSEIALGTNRVSIHVRDAILNDVESALVCLMKGDETWTRAITDASGILEMPTGPQTEGTLWLTVSKPNFVPYQADITVSEHETYVGYVEAEIDDDTSGGTFGNNDGELNPGETVDLTITAHNFGTSVTATNIVGTLSSFDTSLVRVIISQQSFPDLVAGAEAQSLGAFRIELSDYAQDENHTPLLLSFESSQQTDTSLVYLTIVSGRVRFDSYNFLLSNNRLDPGETEELQVAVINRGHREVTNAQGHLFTDDPRITFPEPNALFGTISVDSTAANIVPFEITADPTTIPGHPTTVGLALSGDDGFLDTTYFSFEVGAPEVWDPVGPDHYGYYCFDDLDTSYELTPEYDWIEIDPAYGGSGDLLPLVDSVETSDDNVVRELPFTFRYYGMDYDTITICSNGWAAMGNQPQFENFRNYHIPGPDGPDAMLAAFWDELVMGTGHVFLDYIETDNLLVIEWSRVATMHNSYPETFELILYDPDVWVTPTGDGIIKYQYREVHNVVGDYCDNDYSTVGIEDHTQLDGVEITYWNRYSPGAAPLDSGRAYLFTTLESSSPVETEQPPAPLEYSLGQNYPNPFNPVTTIPYSLRESAHVKLMVYNILGQKVATLVNARQEAGSHHALLDGTALASGIYFYRLQAGDYADVQKMVLMK